MKIGMKMYDTERERGYEWKVVLIIIFVVGSESWVIIDYVIWLLSREQFPVDTFLLCREN